MAKKIEDLVKDWSEHLKSKNRDILLCMDGEAFGTNCSNDAFVHAENLEDKSVYLVNKDSEFTLAEKPTEEKKADEKKANSKKK